MRHFRDVDATAKWMKNALNEDMLVPAMAQAVLGEIEAQATHIADLEIEISARGSSIMQLEKEVERLNSDLEEKIAQIARMKEVIETLGIKAKVMRMLKEEF